MVVSPREYPVKSVIENGVLVPGQQYAWSKLQVCQLRTNISNIYSHSSINEL